MRVRAVLFFLSLHIYNEYYINASRPSLYTYQTYFALRDDPELNQIVNQRHLEEAQNQLNEWPEFIEWNSLNNRR